MTSQSRCLKRNQIIIDLVLWKWKISSALTHQPPNKHLVGFFSIRSVCAFDSMHIIRWLCVRMNAKAGHLVSHSK